MEVCVIGAGAAGLASARHAKEAGFRCTIYEMSSDAGGVWVYTDDTYQDKFGYPVHSAMYKGLYTNLPKEIMGFPDYTIEGYQQSYLSQDRIFKFLNSYADNFDIRPLIKFNHMVTKVKPLEGNKWLVTVEDKTLRKPFEKVFDSVMICTGHYSSPYVPEIPGRETFKGEQFHSKYYRAPDPYLEKDVLLIGAGPSGIDMALHLSKTARKIYFSHNNETLTAVYPENVIMKPLTVSINENGVEFEDNTSCCVDVIFYCTGYIYDFPFLDESCGIKVTDNYITPIYKHIIHIDKPTMCFIGIPFNVCAFQMFDLQARFYVNYLKGVMALPSVDEMRRITREELEDRLSKGFTLREGHMLGPYQRAYYSDLANLAKTHDIPEVMLKIKDASFARLREDLLNFRQDSYRIIDDENFVRVH